MNKTDYNTLWDQLTNAESLKSETNTLTDDASESSIKFINPGDLIGNHSTVDSIDANLSQITESRRSSSSLFPDINIFSSSVNRSLLTNLHSNNLSDSNSSMFGHCTAILANSAKGKSFLVDKLVEAFSSNSAKVPVLTLADEPFEDNCFKRQQFISIRYASLLDILFIVAMNAGKTIIIDSTRHLFMNSGALASGGISRLAGIYLTAIQQVAVKYNCHVIVTVNLNEDDLKAARGLDLVAGSVDTVIYLNPFNNDINFSLQDESVSYRGMFNLCPKADDLEKLFVGISSRCLKNGRPLRLTDVASIIQDIVSHSNTLKFSTSGLSIDELEMVREIRRLSKLSIIDRVEDLTNQWKEIICNPGICSAPKYSYAISVIESCIAYQHNTLVPGKLNNKCYVNVSLFNRNFNEYKNLSFNLYDVFKVIKKADHNLMLIDNSEKYHFNDSTNDDSNQFTQLSESESDNLNHHHSYSTSNGDDISMESSKSTSNSNVDNPSDVTNDIPNSGGDDSNDHDIDHNDHNSTSSDDVRKEDTDQGK